MTDAQRTSVLCTVTFAEGLRWFDDARTDVEIADMADRVLARAAENGKLAGVPAPEIVDVLRSECERMTRLLSPALGV